MYQPYSVLA